MKATAKFEEISAHYVNLAGGKGASLGEMTRAGVPVPDGFIIVAPVFTHILKKTGLESKISTLLSSIDYENNRSLERASKQIRQLIGRIIIPIEIKTEILESFAQLKSSFVAVRSSATAEDSASDAWAGQLDTYLNTTKQNLLLHVKKCWASLYTPRALFYRYEKKLLTKHISVAVVVQHMVQSTIAGVAFSVNPITKDKRRVVIEAGWGLGETVVSGAITPDKYIYDKKDEIIELITIGKQQRQLVKVGRTNKLTQVPKQKVWRQKLDGKQILELVRLILRIEQHYQFPCDIEWAVVKENIYITQSRPITTL